MWVVCEVGVVIRRFVGTNRLLEGAAQFKIQINPSAARGKACTYSFLVRRKSGRRIQARQASFLGAMHVRSRG